MAALLRQADDPMLLSATILGLSLTAVQDALPPQDAVPVVYEPRHMGGADLATGLYVRRDDDVVINGAPLLILRRTYLAGYRTSKQFGIGTTHDGEIYLHGDFQQISLIQADGSRILFRRRPGEPSIFKAVWVHDSGPSEWLDAEMRFALFGWKIRRRDGSELAFQSCGPGTKVTTCSIVQSKDPQGRSINYRRDFEGRLVRMEADSDRWIAFDYDSRNRITRARGSDGAIVEYQYDAAGRLWQAFATDGRVHRYLYNDRDELVRIFDPGHTLENRYDANGRMVHQVNRFAGDPEPLIFTFSYDLRDGKVVRTESTRSDGESSRYEFNKDSQTVSMEWRVNGRHLATLEFERQPVSQVLTAITVSCQEEPARRRTYPPPPDDDRRGHMRLVYTCLPASR